MQHQHTLAKQSIWMQLYRLFFHGMLGIVLILPPLLGEEAQSADVQFNNAANQVQSVMTQTTNQTEKDVAGNLNKHKKPNIARRERDLITITVEEEAVNHVDAAGSGTRMVLTETGDLLVMAENEMTLSEIAHTQPSQGTFEPAVILLMQAALEDEEIPEPRMGNVIRINAQTIRK